jgi:hypothetical protein
MKFVLELNRPRPRYLIVARTSKRAALSRSVAYFVKPRLLCTVKYLVAVSIVATLTFVICSTLLIVGSGLDSSSQCERKWGRYRAVVWDVE